jgi:hypothetical protein
MDGEPPILDEDAPSAEENGASPDVPDDAA